MGSTALAAAATGGAFPKFQGQPSASLAEVALRFCMKEKAQGSGQRKDDRGRTNPPGQNPQQNDAVDHDLYNDEGRPNLAKDKQCGG